MMKSTLIEVTTLGDLLLRGAENWPDREALVFPQERLTYAQLADRALHKARALQGMGIEPGHHVGILSPNLVEVVELMFATALSGAVAVMINARYKTRELAYVIENADLKLLFTTNRIADYVNFAELLYESLPGLESAGDPLRLKLETAPLLHSVVMMEDPGRDGIVPFSRFMEYTEKTTEEQVWQRRSQVALSDPCIMMYTSGTTANPKGCRLSHEALVRNAREMGIRFGITDQDRQWNPLPMFHMGAILPILSCYWAGAGFCTDTHFDPDPAIDAIIAEKPTIMFTAFPTVMAALVGHPRFDAGQMSQIRLVNNVAPPSQLKKNMEILPDAVHVSAYGLTEASGVSCNGSPGEDDETLATTCGKPYSGVQLRVIDLETGKAVTPGGRGEVVIRGFSLFEGYYKSPDKTAETIDGEGWLHTGDIATLDPEGRVSYQGRIKDMPKVGGENVAAVEIESYIFTHPSVQLVQVVGVPDEKMVEVAAAFIELKPGMECTEQEIIDYCQGKIASFKIPRHVRFVTEWPMSATKIQKFKLQEALSRELEGSGDTPA
jgi:acyl-CoA synthetase (AMP-forming)/AMP-acid ligase II